MLKSYKERQFLVFEFDDGKNVKYNLATGESIGKSGKVVKDVCTQLRGYDYLQVIDSFQDEKYREFLNFVDHRVNRVQRWNRSSYYSPGSKAKNVGTFLKNIKHYSEYEQFFAAGITKIEHPLYTSFGNIPKGLLNLCREYDFKLDNYIIQGYNEHKDLFGVLLELQKELNNINKSDILKLLKSNNNRYFSLYQGDYRTKFIDLIGEKKYKPVSLIKYIDNLMTYEALEGIENVINEFYDYVNMMSSITNKYTKYPKNFLTTHRIASRNYSRMKREYPEAVFKSRINKDYEFVHDEFKIIYPESTKEIKEEGIGLNHCVASYIDKVIDGSCHIVFLRNKEQLNKSLVTLEVRNGKVVQARGSYNREVNEKEKKVIEKYNKKLERMLKAC